MSPVRKIRIYYQVFFLVLFLFLLGIAQERWIGGHAVSLFLHIDPLVGIASAIASRALAAPLLLGLILVVATLVFGRFFCGWICPYGTLHQFVGWLGSRWSSKRERLDKNAYRPVYALKYVVLVAFLVMAVFGVMQIGLLDPIVLFTRAGATFVIPGVDEALRSVNLPALSVRPRFHHQATVIATLFLGFLALNLWIPRFFCRAICPLGALLGVFSRFSLWRIRKDENACTSCRLCQVECEGAADPLGDVRKAECYICWKCVDVCKGNALRYTFYPSDAESVPAPDLQRRRLLAGLATGLVVPPILIATGTGRRRSRPDLIRPPGTRAEPDFLELCVKCDACVRVCPTNVIQPSFLEGGVEALWTPLLDMRIGYCELNCTLCGQVCPTTAIRPISLDEKLGRGDFEGEPIRLGTAFFDRGRCLPWAMDTPCVVCEEVCPVSPKAIFTREETIVGRDGGTLTLSRPYMDPSRCIGCGLCQHSCPVQDKAAVRVTSVGETRGGADARLLLR